MLSSDIYKNLIGIVVDEAHCISHWSVLFLLLKRPFWSADLDLLLNPPLHSFIKKLFSNIFNAQFCFKSYVLSLISHLNFFTITLSFQVILYFPWNFRISFNFLLLHSG